MAQSGLEKNEYIPEEIKLIYREIKDDDILKYAEKFFISSHLKIDGHQIEKSAKKKAKDFFFQVLLGKESGDIKDQELRNDLYKQAVKAIDSAECVWSPSAANSYKNPLGIKCYYLDEDDLILSLVHETSHVLEDEFYKLRKKYRKSDAQILNQEEILSKDIRCEYVSIFFERLLAMDSFKGSFVKGYPLRRIWDLSKKLWEWDLIRELAISYNKNSELYNQFLHGYKRDEVISELEKNATIKLYMDIYEEWDGILIGYHSFKYRRDVWAGLLQKVADNKRDPCCAELNKWLHNLETGECNLIGVKEKIHVFTFLKDGKEIKRSFPRLMDDKIENNWGRFCDYITRKSGLSWENSLKNSNDTIKNIGQELHRKIDEYENNIVNYDFGSGNNAKAFCLEICESLENIGKTQMISWFLPQLNENDWSEIKNSVDNRFDYIFMQRYFEDTLKILNYKELIQLFRETLEGKIDLINYKLDEDDISGFLFEKNGELTTVILPLWLGFNWKEIKEWTTNSSCFHFLSPIINSAVNFANGYSMYSKEEHLLGTFNTFKVFEKYDFAQILKSKGWIITEELMDELTQRGFSIWTEEFIEWFCNYLKERSQFLAETVILNRTLLLHARSHPAESMNKDQVKHLKYLEQYKPLGITKDIAEKFLEFWRI